MKKQPIKVVHRKLGKHKAIGLAWTEERKIEIDTRLQGYDLLYVTLHEIVHIQNPKWSEIKVEGHSKEMADLLWQQGFRKTI